MTLTLDDNRVEAPTSSTRIEGDRARRPRRRLGRRTHRLLLTTHILTSVGWFGVAVTVAFTAIAAGANDNVAFYEVIRTSLWLSVPLGLGAAATGLALSLTTRWGLVRHWWVVIKEGITIAVIATDVLVIGPEMGKAIDSGTTGAIPGPVYAHCVVLAIATALSVIKPKAETPLARR